MITQEEINLLVNYTAREGIAISFFLNTDGSERSKAMWDIETKDLVKNARQELLKLDANRRYLEAADENLKRIQAFVTSGSLPPKYKSVAVFSNSAENFYQIYRLPVPIKSNLILDVNFYLRPLIALLEEKHRVGMILVDSKHARLFETYMGEIVEHHNFFAKTRATRKPLLETFMKREKRLMQRREEDTRFHLSSVAEQLKLHHRLRHFDKLIIGGRKPLGDHLARLLNRNLRDSLVGIVETDIRASEADVLSVVLKKEKEFESEEERRLLRRICEEIEKDGYATKGIKNVIESLHEFNVQTLAVAEDFSRPGLACQQCGMPHYEGNTCVCCGEQLIKVSDVVYDLVEEAARQGAVVRHIHGDTLIRSLENVAAIIKFRKGELVRVEEAAETEA